MFRRHLALLLIALLAVATAASPVSAGGADGDRGERGSGKDKRSPDLIELPDGFFPEGIAIGRGATFFTGSLVDGAIYRGDVRTGKGAILVDGQDGLVAVGMDVGPRDRLLFVAGGPTGTARVYDTRDGSLVDDLTLGAGFINDVITTDHAAYFTNSAAPELYEVPLDRRGAVAGPVRVIPLSGDFEFVPDAFNANGIESLNRRTLIIVNSSVGALYRVDVASGEATLIETDQAVNGDGLVLKGRTLYAVVGSRNQVVELRLSRDRQRADVVDIITDDNFDVPTTAALRGSSLYVVNAKFGTPPTPTQPYEVVRVKR